MNAIPSLQWIPKWRFVGVFFLLWMLCSSCQEEVVNPGIQRKDLKGFWAPYYVDDSTGAFHWPAVSGNTIFQFYCDCILFGDNGKCEPIFWDGVEKIDHRVHGDGRYTISSDSILQLRQTGWDLDLPIVKFSGDTMWLEAYDRIYKLLREPK